MKRYLGFCPAQYGDLFMMTVAARCLKRTDPDCHLTFVIAADFRECAPLFIDYPYIDRIHILNKARDGFDQTDWEWIAQQRFDGVFNPMQDHDPSQSWWQHRNQSLEAAHMHGLSTAGDDGQIRLTRWFKPTPGLEDYVAISPWPSFHEGTANPKAIPPARAQEIVNWLRSEGWKVLQVGGPNEPQLEGVEKPVTDYFTSVRNVLGCRAMIMGDSGLNWCLSGYGFPVIGLYSYRYFGHEFVHHIQPINPNGHYLAANSVAEIDLDNVLKAVKMAL